MNWQPAAIRVSCHERPGDGVLAVVSNLGPSVQTAVDVFDLPAGTIQFNRE